MLAKWLVFPENKVIPFLSFFMWFNSGAPAGAEGARGRSIHSYRIWWTHRAEKIWLWRHVRTSVRPYARIRPGDEFAFVLDLESFLRKKWHKNKSVLFGSFRVELPVVKICKNSALLQRFKMIWTFHFNLNDAIVWKGDKNLWHGWHLVRFLRWMKEANKAAGKHRSSWIFLALFTHLHHGNLCQMI